MRWLFLGLLILQTATCGQTGPLILPEEQEQSSLTLIAPSTASATAPATPARAV